jgi:hypothetical protein
MIAAMNQAKKNKKGPPADASNSDVPRMEQTKNERQNIKTHNLPITIDRRFQTRNRQFSSHHITAQHHSSPTSNSKYAKPVKYQTNRVSNPS